LSISGQTYRKTFEVKMDPRVSFTRNALQSALQLQLKISDALGRNFAAYRQVKELRTRLAELTKRPSEDPVAAAATVLDKKAADLAGESVAILEAPTTGSFLTVNDSLTALIALVDGADVGPSEAEAAAYQNLCETLNKALDEWNSLKSKDVAALNVLLTDKKLTKLPDFPNIAGGMSCAK
jgi:hypothetical protein